MQIHPTRTAVHLAFSGVFVLAAGVVLRAPAVVAWGGAIAFGLALARAVTLVSVHRIREAGFEMLWAEPARVVRTVRGAELVVRAEVRNRDERAARFVGVRVLASEALEVEVSPAEAEVPGGGSVPVSVKLRARRVGRHALHALTLELRGQPGLFEVPLAFANPLGVEVLPRAFGWLVAGPRGGRSRLAAPEGRSSRTAGEGSDLRELRDWTSGDPFPRIAWKPSARRGKLLVREMEREERDVVWLVLDASAELAAGAPGRAPLDAGIDAIAAAAVRHLGRGDRVGLAVVAGHAVRVRLRPAAGPAHALAIAAALAEEAASWDASRSAFDEERVAARVREHLATSQVAGDDAESLDALAARAEAALGRAPFPASAPDAPTPRERALRRYAAGFALSPRPPAIAEGRASAATIATLLGAVANERPRATLVHLWCAPPGETEAELEAALRALVRKGVGVTVTLANAEAAAPDGAAAPQARTAARAAELRGAAQRERARRRLGAMGVRLAHGYAARRLAPEETG